MHINNVLFVTFLIGICLRGKFTTYLFGFMMMYICKTFTILHKRKLVINYVGNYLSNEGNDVN